MELNSTQRAALRAAIDADQAASDLLTDGNLGGLADYFNAPSSAIVWRTSVSVDDIFDQIVWANFTPSPVPDGTAAWTNRSLACQGKQFNVQTMLVGRATLNPSKQRTRNGLQDALTDVPSGNNGNFRQAGWTEVLSILHRPATRLEALFATGSGTVASPSLMSVEGSADYTIFIGI